MERLPETYVNREGVEKGEIGSFTYFDLSNGDAKWRVPFSGDRIRVSRERLRSLMLQGLDVEWERKLVDVKKGSGGVVAVFENGTEVKGAVLMGCDGANSNVRKLCHPDTYRNDQLPVRFIGAGVRYTETEIRELRKLDPFFLQGSNPSTDAFLWFSFLDTPTDPDPSGTKTEDDKYYCQIMTSWPYRSGFLGHSDPIEMPETRAEQLRWMKTLAKDWTEPFHSLIMNIPDGENDCEIMPVYLADWLPRRTTAFDGRVVLLGDAAHTMVMFRGEGANHAIVDVSMALDHIVPLIKSSGGNRSDDALWKKAVEDYEREMIERSELAVMASRQACIDAHDYKRLDDKSPLVRRRLMRADFENTD